MTTQKTALVTGANKGIGRATAELLAREGYMVFAGARNAELGRAAADEMRANGLEVEPLILDVTDPGSIAEAAGRIQKAVGHLDLLVNNAGVALEMAGPAEASLAVIRQTYETNVLGVVAVTQQMLPLLRDGQGKSIINVSSETGSLTLHSDPGFAFGGLLAFAYNSSKTALNAFTVLLAKELAADGIRVNAVNPGFSDTDINGHMGTQSVDDAATSVLTPLRDSSLTGQFLGESGFLPW